MSQENVDLALRAVDATNRRDLDAFLALVDEEVESVSRIAAMEGGLHGHEGVRRWWESWFEAFPDYRIEVLGTSDVGDAVIATFRAVGRARASELPFEDKAWYVSHWRNGKCVRWQVCVTEAEALAVASRSEG